MSWAARALHWLVEYVHCLARPRPDRKWLGNPGSPCHSRTGDRWLQLFALNEECLVGVGHQPTPIVSLPFVHTARRCYRWQWDRAIRRSGAASLRSRAELGRCPSARGSKSRNKVVVGEPAAGSLPIALCATHVRRKPACDDEWEQQG